MAVGTKVREPQVSVWDADKERYVYDSVAFQEANDKSNDFFLMLARKRQREQAEDMKLRAFDPQALPVMYETLHAPYPTDEEIDASARQIVDNIFSTHAQRKAAQAAEKRNASWKGIFSLAPSSVTYEYAASQRDRTEPGWRERARAAGIAEYEARQQAAKEQTAFPEPMRCAVKLVGGKLVVVKVHAPIKVKKAKKDKQIMQTCSTRIKLVNGKVVFA